MNIVKNTEGKVLNIALEGRLDTTTAPQLEAELKQSIADNTELIFDFEKLEYLSSAGLRILLAAQKVMNKQGKMVIRNVNDVISEVFDSHSQATGGLARNACASSHSCRASRQL